jgi:hypothetical protein
MSEGLLQRVPRSRAQGSGFKNGSTFTPDGDLPKLKHHFRVYKGTSLIRKRLTLGPYSRDMPRPSGGPGGAAVSYERGTPAGFRVRVHGCRHLRL